MNFFIKNKNKIYLVLVTLVLLIVMFVSGYVNKSINMLPDFLSVFIKPIESFTTSVVNSFSGDEEIKKENTRLKSELAQLSKDAKDFDELKAQNEKLRMMLDIKNENSDMDLVATSVISYGFESWKSTLKLDKGLKDGIKTGDVVITHSGLVGKITEVGRDYSVVTTLIDTSSKVSAKLERLDAFCMVSGDTSVFNDKLLMVKYINSESDISVGDVLHTSGDGGVYPKGLVIGKITKVTQNGDSLSKDAIVEPIVDISSLKDVLVIKTKRG